MIIDLKPLFRGDTDCLPLDYSFDLSETDIHGIRPFADPVILTGRVYLRADVVSLDAYVTAVYTGICDRCGRDIRKECRIRISRDIVTDLANEDNDDFIVAEDMQLDLKELALSEIILNLPMKQLCSDDCKGVCQKCGANLNDGDCGCVTKEIDPRLSALQDLLNQ